MSELDVEPVDRIDEGDLPVGVDAPEYVLYGGKGGVGKTTMAAATGLASARGGTATLVVSTDPAHSLSDTFETEIPASPERIREDVPLYAAEIDPDAALEAGNAVFGGARTDDAGAESATGTEGNAGFGGESGVGAGGSADDDAGSMGGLGGLLGGDDPMDALLGGPMPGADEAAAMQKLLEFMDDERFDRVVVDTAPTGHTLRLLELPELLDTMVGRIVKLKQQFGQMMEGVKGMFGGEGVDPEEGFDDLEELGDRVERLRATLRDPSKTDFRVVMVPEEMSVFESQRLLGQLREFEIPAGTVVVNRVMEDLTAVSEAGDADAFVSPDLDDCAFCQRRWQVQQEALAEAQDVFRGHEVKRVPLLADEVRGERALTLVASCLD